MLFLGLALKLLRSRKKDKRRFDRRQNRRQRINKYLYENRRN